MSDFGTTIRRMRKEQNLSVRKLAELSGVSHPYLSQIENGKNNASPTIIMKLAKGLKCHYRLLLVEAGYEMDERDMTKYIKTYPFIHCENKEFEFHCFSVNLDVTDFIRTGTGEFKDIPFIQTCDNCGYKIEREDIVKRIEIINGWIKQDLITNKKT